MRGTHRMNRRPLERAALGLAIAAFAASLLGNLAHPLFWAAFTLTGQDTSAR